MTVPAYITRTQVRAAAKALGLNPERVTEATITATEVEVTILDVEASKEDFVTHTYTFPIIKERK